MAALSTVADKLKLCLATGEGILARLYWMRRSLAEKRQSYFSDPVISNFVQALTKRFPEIPADLEKQKGYDVFQSRAAQLLEEAEPDYSVMLDVIEWSDRTQDVLNAAFGEVVALNLSENPFMTIRLLELTTLFVRLHILFSRINERKTVLSVYSRALFHKQGEQDRNFPKAATFLVDIDDPFKFCSSCFKGFVAKLGAALVKLFPEYNVASNVNELRKQGALSLTLKPSNMTLPTQSPLLSEVDLLDKMTEWLSFCLLFTPEEFGDPQALHLAKMCLSRQFVFPLVYDEDVGLHSEYEGLFSQYKSAAKGFQLKKDKKAISDAHKAALAARSHRDLRIYLKQELHNLLCLIKGCPGLLGPKLYMVITGLRLARDEIVWYFRHRHSPPKSVTRFLEEFRDDNISDLVHYVDVMSDLVRKHRTLIQTYYLQYARGADSKAISELLKDPDFSRHMTDEACAVLGKLLEELQALPEALPEAGEALSTVAMRETWHRLEAYLSLKRGTALPSMKEGLWKITSAMRRVRYIDDLPGLLDENTSLKQLWFYQREVWEDFTKIVEGTGDQVLHVISWIRIFAQFPSVVTMYNPDVMGEVGAKSVEMADRAVEVIASQAMKLLKDSAKQHQGFDLQTQSCNAAYEVLAKANKEKSAFPQRPVVPGTESSLKDLSLHSELRVVSRQLEFLCAAFRGAEEVRVFDTAFLPQTLFREKVFLGLRQELVDLVREPGKADMITRPTVIEKSLNSYIFSLCRLEKMLDIDMPELIRQVLITQTWNPILSNPDHGWAKGSHNELQWDDEVGGMVSVLVNWYVDLVANKASQPGAICVSESRKAFVSRPNFPFKTEEYTDPVSMTSLARLIGPCGVKLMDRALFTVIAKQTQAIKDIITANRQPLEELTKAFHTDAVSDVFLKKVRDLEPFVGRAITIGNCLTFRENMHDALRRVVSARTPLISETISIAFDEYNRNVFMVPELLSLDALADTAGLPMGVADQALKIALAGVVLPEDKATWDLLPALFALAFLSKTASETAYRNTLEAHSNNLHTLVRAIVSLIVSSQVLTASDEQTQQTILESLKSFLSMGCMLMLRKAKAPTGRASTVPAVMVFFDLFVRATPMLTRDMLESIVPYSLFRSYYRELYDVRRAAGEDNN
mmetsp:Transcript_22496/g.56419  ORF Transcript_22496/g.56419 Transcript_22496/m.56419 type:complete len:1144 (-) Transcript_22496:147-3578(-)|eukprot:CAMPEP_0177643654 /NCGR_PEP_ID=MMETSP0447-20121125/8264_1 /TAXON_ID=0 /ORGANISM="Stygamoeba regulata, Strain BSH-02190019" /LENGTH=1143 /DNA_ID=CAMNT_0019145951 /DNA_START=117 /DNA_END=3548 /DNA_ORIENTATION=+